MSDVKGFLVLKLKPDEILCPTSNHIRVIEYSTYENALKRIEKLKAAIVPVIELGKNLKPSGFTNLIRDLERTLAEDQGDDT